MAYTQLPIQLHPSFTLKQETLGLLCIPYLIQLLCFHIPPGPQPFRHLLRIQTWSYSNLFSQYKGDHISIYYHNTKLIIFQFIFTIQTWSYVGIGSFFSAFVLNEKKCRFKRKKQNLTKIEKKNVFFVFFYFF